MLPARALVLAPLLAAAQFAPAQGTEPPRITVTCLDAEGKPVAGAEVHVFQLRKSPAGTDYVPSGPHPTDANGVATTAVALDLDGGRFDRWLYARVPGRLVGATRWFRFGGAPVGEPTLRMEPSREVRGVVRVPDGSAARTVVVHTLSLSALDDAGAMGPPFPRYHEFAGLRGTLPALFDAPVADDGTFALRDLPRRPLLYLAAEGPGLAQGQWFNALLPDRRIPDTVEIAMAREGVVEGTVTDAAGKPLGAASVTLRIHSAACGRNQRLRRRCAPTGKAAGRCCCQERLLLPLRSRRITARREETRSSRSW